MKNTVILLENKFVITEKKVQVVHCSKRGGRGIPSWILPEARRKRRRRRLHWRNFKN